MKKKLLVFIGFLLLLSPLLFLVFRELARMLVDRLVALYWYFGPYVEAVPQPAVWALLLLAAVLILMSSLLGRREPREKPQKTGRARLGRVGFWAREIRKASSRSSRRGFYRWQLAQDLGALARDVLAHSERLGPGQVGRPLEAGTSGIPPEILAYLEAGRTTEHVGRFSGLRRLFRLGTRTSPLALDPQQLVEFLEEQMEV